MKCPKCQRDDEIDVVASIAVRLTPDGTDTDRAFDNSHEWGESSVAHCCHCAFCGLVSDFTIPAPPAAKKWYVSMTWEGWPEGGSYAAAILAISSEDAEEKCRQEMAENRGESDDPEFSPQYYLEHYGHSWQVVDCFPIDEFIARHSRT